MEIDDDVFEGTVADIIARLRQFPQDASIFQEHIEQSNGIIDGGSETVKKFFLYSKA